MASTVSLEEVKKIISFPVKGEKWVLKNLIGAALILGNYILPLIPTLPVLGYAARVMKHVINDEDPALPEWNDWGSLFLDGIKVFGVVFIFELPALLVMLAGYAVVFIPVFIMAMNSNAKTLPDLFVPAEILGNFGGMAFFLLGSFLSLAIMMFLPPALGNMIVRGDFAAAFRFKEWWPIFKASFGGYLVAIMLLLGMYIVLVFAVEFLVFTVILCLLVPIGMSFVNFALLAVMMALFGVAYRDGVRKLAAQPA